MDDGAEQSSSIEPQHLQHAHQHAHPLPHAHPHAHPQDRARPPSAHGQPPPGPIAQQPPPQPGGSVDSSPPAPRKRASVLRRGPPYPPPRAYSSSQGPGSETRVLRLPPGQDPLQRGPALPAIPQSCIKRGIQAQCTYPEDAPPGPADAQQPGPAPQPGLSTLIPFIPVTPAEHPAP
ncbi:hypothetical protein K488DRAFT_91720 [Vararia minispora EC-137]|uniref:Uncharacterized protein n=1 Tax=Vararia minispora EC-137 TaxID=1314806 RepID=A0ACB8Q586_9AGAM|nr:hypothetical protein K488DRAFT_91720 [Vararia minispora EC-137]